MTAEPHKPDASSVDRLGGHDHRRRDDQGRPVERTSFAPGGDKVSQPGVRENDLADPSGEDAQRPSTHHDAQPRPEAER